MDKDTANSRYVKKIVEDLEERDLIMAGVLASDPATGTLRFITYSGNGLVDTISQPEEIVSLYGKSRTAGGMHEILTISCKIPADKGDDE